MAQSPQPSTGRRELVLRHLFDSALVSLFAALGTALLFGALGHRLQAMIAATAAAHSPWVAFWGLVASLLAFVFAAGLAPDHFRSTVSGLWRFPFHCGLAARCWSGGAICIVLMWMLGFAGLDAFSACVALVAYTVVLGFGLLLGSAVARVLCEWHAAKRTVAATEPSPEPHETSFSLSSWLSDDRPITSAAESLLPSHRHVANRILERLVLPTDCAATRPPNIGLVGTYGSGKTSICNVVESEYERLRTKRPEWPRLLFCRFEAWRYMSPEAAVRGLVDSAASRVLREADECSFWTLGERYVRAASAAGLGWAGAIAFLLGGDRQPDVVMKRLGDLLVRLNKRLVILVDDLDRIERTSVSEQDALVQALNQFQEVANVQYLLTLGPSHWAASQASDRRPMLDLLKLTRFQELVPDIEPDHRLSVVRELRHDASADTSVFMPWAQAVHDRDPLAFPSWYGSFPLSVRGLAGILVELLRTPRELKSALRETRTAWMGGLDGEINWYDLLLANALKVSEPSVFEWVLRDQAVFTGTKADLGRRDSEAQTREADTVRERLRTILQVDSQDRLAAVTDALCRLFPAFAQIINAQGAAKYEPVLARQDLASTPLSGESYFHRYVAGQVPVLDLPDRPILEYIKRVRDQGFEPRAFEAAYLGSLGKLGAPLDKIVQFARFLGSANALAMCDTILAWAARPESIHIWPAPSRFYPFICGDMYHILSESRAPDLGAWVCRKVGDLGATAPLLVESLIGMLEPGDGHAFINPEEARTARQRLAIQVADEFVVGARPFLAAVGQYPFELLHMVRFVLSAHPDYVTLKNALTRKLTGECAQDGTGVLKREVLLALTSEAVPRTMRGPIPPEARQFTYDKARNAQWFDMDALLPHIWQWHAEGVPDPLAQKVLGEIAEVYRSDAPASEPQA